MVPPQEALVYAVTGKRRNFHVQEPLRVQRGFIIKPQEPPARTADAIAAKPPDLPATLAGAFAITGH